MSVRPHTRRLAAILFTDIVNYSALVGGNEKLTLELVDEHRRSVRSLLSNYGGIEVKTTGDGFLLEFSSIVSALQCAMDIQTAQFEKNINLPEERRLLIRIGVHLGDIMDSEEDRFGNEVNIAARIEPLARPGGISISQQVADQIQGKLDLPLRRLGRVPLKNIKAQAEVFQVIMPWESDNHSLWDHLKRIFKFKKIDSSFFKWEVRLLTVQVLFVTALLGWVTYEVSHSTSLVPDRGPNRTPAIYSGNKPRFILPDNWHYSLGKEIQPQLQWKDFLINQPFQYADEIKGDYLLKLEFKGKPEFRHPSIMIGLISDAHRAYLNGQFIGGSENFSDLAKYSFDPSILREDRENTLIIKAKTRQTFTPGIYKIPKTQPFIGEFSDVSEVVDQNDIFFHVFPSIYLTISLLIAFASLGYSFFRRANHKYLYLSFLLFLGTLGISYYNSYVINALDFRVYRFFRVLALGWSSFALCSNVLRSYGMRKYEIINNIAAIVLSGIAAILLLNDRLSPSLYFLRYEAAFTVVTLYTVVWLCVLLGKAFSAWSKTKTLSFLSELRGGDSFLSFGFGLVFALIGYATIQRSVFTTDQHDQIRVVSMIYPFIFALIIFYNGVVDYISKARRMAYKQRKDDLLLAVSALTASGNDVSDTLTAIQQKVTEFLGATRSTIYIAHEENGTRYLKASYVQGSADVKRRIESAVLPKTGVIGYCVQNRTSLWVEDIQKDARFSSQQYEQKNDPKGSSYQTGSFIVIPLILQQQILGVITVADRIDGEAFSREDYCLLHLAAKDLSSILGSVQHKNPVSTLRLVA